MITHYSYWAVVLGGVLIIASCTWVELPPVPPLTSYQPAHIKNPSDHGKGDLTIAIPENHPPYFDGRRDDGIERDIIRESFAAVKLYPEFMATAKRQEKYDSKRFGLDCVSTVSKEYQLKSKSYFSDIVISYHYTPFALKKSGVSINDYSDLAGKSVEAFSSANRYLGTEFTDMIPHMASYAQHQNRFSQVALLLVGHVDVLIIDRGMFYFVRRSLMNERPEYYDAEITEVPVEKVIDFSLVCHNENTIKEFNKGLAMLRANHRYEAIFKQYLLP